MQELRLLQAYRIPNAQRESRTALVPAIRRRVHAWRLGGYDGVTGTTRRLLRHWFETDHESGDEPWLYYYCQREAIETIIFLYEVMQHRSLYELAREFDDDRRVQLNPGQDRWARYVCKMATGSGKTKVMSLAIVWSYFNALRERERRRDYSRTFAVIAPNVIVYQRLLDDFRDGKIFRADPLIPPEWSGDWRMTVVTRDDPVHSSTPGTLYLTNVHQLYDPSKRRCGGQEPAAMTAVLGGPRPAGSESSGPGLRQRMMSHGELMVLNDEGHHLHTDELEWAKVIEELHGAADGGLTAQLDFTATPKHQNGRLFDEIVVDYPVAQAIQDGIVKQPILGTLRGDATYASENAAEAHRDKLTAGIKKWRERRDELAKVERKPLLFIMAENTKAADEIADWLPTQGITESEILNIHTNRKGEISEGTTAKAQRELDELREAARRVDEPDNPYSAIVSVLMLREGWDVRNVCVIVALRPYTAASQILPEQTLGRGLRRMFPVASGEDAEQVIVIEHEAFIEFWKREIEAEDIDMPIVPVGQLRTAGQTIYVDPEKLEYDIEIPEVTPAVTERAPDWNALDIEQIEPGQFPSPYEHSVGEDTFTYIGRHMLTFEVVDRDEIERDFPLEPVGFLNEICRKVLRECRLHNLADTFARLAPLMKRYIEQRLFEVEVSMEDELVMRRLNGVAQKVWLYERFVHAIRALAWQETPIRVKGERRLVSEAKPLWSSRPAVRARKTVFNLVPYDSGLEADFTRFLDAAPDVAAFARNTTKVGLKINYLKSTGAVGVYYPDFIVRTADAHVIVETKGLEDIEVAQKDRRARQWCEAVSAATGHEWRYLKVAQEMFERGPWASLGELEAAIGLAGD